MLYSLIILDIIRTHSTGYFPIAVSAANTNALEPFSNVSIMSFTSALVGFELLIIFSIKLVATYTGVEKDFAVLII